MCLQKTALTTVAFYSLPVLCTNVYNRLLSIFYTKLLLFPCLLEMKWICDILRKKWLKMYNKWVTSCLYWFLYVTFCIIFYYSLVLKWPKFKLPFITCAHFKLDNLLGCTVFLFIASIILMLCCKEIRLNKYRLACVSKRVNITLTCL